MKLHVDDLDCITSFVADGLYDQFGCGDVVPFESLITELNLERRLTNVYVPFTDVKLCHDMLSLQLNIKPKGVY